MSGYSAILSAAVLLSACARQPPSSSAMASTAARHPEIAAADLVLFLARHSAALPADISEQVSSCDRSSCFDRGESISLDTRASAVQALPFFLRACDLGHDEGCLRMTTALATNRSFSDGTLDYFEGDEAHIKTRHLAYADRACSIDADNCVFWAGHALHNPFVDAQTADRAHDTLESACDAGTEQACKSLGFYYSARGKVHEPQQSRSYYERACALAESSTAQSCLSYATALSVDEGLEPDPGAVVEVLDARCLPASALWSAHCSGEPGSSEVCDMTFAIQEGAACAVKASALHKLQDADPDATLRLLNIACYPRTVFSADDARLLMDACDQAVNIHLERQTPAEAIVGLQERRCEAHQQACWERLGPTAEICWVEEDNCKAAISR